MTIQTKTRKILTALFVGLFAFIILSVTGVAVVTYLPGIHLNDWFRATANYWLLFRIAVYLIVGVFIYFIQQSAKPLPRNAIILILLAFYLNEGLNFFYRS